MKRYAVGKAYDHEDNVIAAAAVLTVYLCPSTNRESKRKRGRGVCDYGGIDGERITSRNFPPKDRNALRRGASILRYSRWRGSYSDYLRRLQLQ